MSSKNYCPIIGTLGFILSECGNKVLMVHRNARKNDDQLGKYNGLGGHMEANEDIATCMKREIMEESGLTVTGMSLRGTVNWTGFGPKGEDWLGFIFLITEYSGEPFERNEEGDLSWVEITSLDSLPMWEGDRHFLPLVFDNDKRPFHGFMPYDGDKPQGWSYIRI